MAKKLSYKIGEACKLLDIQPYVLRYWETEFPVLAPKKSKSGQRTYSSQEIEIIRRIKELLYEEGYTIAGAKKKLDAESKAPPPKPAPQAKKKTTRKSTKAQPASAPAEEPKAAAPVDSEAVEKVKVLRAGVEEALLGAREILDLLQKSSETSSSRPAS